MGRNDPRVLRLRGCRERLRGAVPEPFQVLHHRRVPGQRRGVGGRTAERLRAERRREVRERPAVGNGRGTEPSHEPDDVVLLPAQPLLQQQAEAAGGHVHGPDDEGEVDRANVGDVVEDRAQVGGEGGVGEVGERDGAQLPGAGAHAVAVRVLPGVDETLHLAGAVRDHGGAQPAAERWHHAHQQRDQCGGRGGTVPTHERHGARVDAAPVAAALDTAYRDPEALEGGGEPLAVPRQPRGERQRVEGCVEAGLAQPRLAGGRALPRLEWCRRDGADLQQVELAVREGPFHVHGVAVPLPQGAAEVGDAAGVGGREGRGCRGLG